MLKRAQFFLLAPVCALLLIALSSQYSFIPPVDAESITLAPLPLDFPRIPSPEPGPRVDSLTEAQSLTGVVSAEALKQLVEDPVISREIEAVITDSLHRDAFWGIDVFDLKEGKFIYSHNSDKRFTPASNAKLFTTAAALEELGPGFRFKTIVGYEGLVSEEGVLMGNLVLIGGGDPDLANLRNPAKKFATLDKLARAVRKAGIKKVEGALIGDDTYFSHSLYGRGWLVSDFMASYGVPVSALSFHDNTLTVQVRPSGQVGQPVRVSTTPSNSALRLVNNARTDRMRRRITLTLSTVIHDSELTISGALPINYRRTSRRIPVGDPALFTAQIFKDRLAKAGVKVDGDVRARHSIDTPWTGHREIVAEHQSEPLSSFIAIINKRSHNLYAELLLRTLGAEIKGTGSDWAGREVIDEFLTAQGIVREAVALYDGSGLSRMSLVTPRAETELLVAMTASPNFFEYKESLPVAGLDGTLGGRMRGTSAAGRVSAKTGTLRNAITLGGYVETRSGRSLAFTIFINNHSFSPAAARSAVDKICGVLAKS